MRILDFLRICDTCGADCTVYSIDDDDECWYEGSIYDMPWHVSLYELVDTPKEAYREDTPVQFRSDLGAEHNHRPGFVFLIKNE